MNEPQQKRKAEIVQEPPSDAHANGDPEGEPAGKGPSLTLMYSLIALALVAAMFLAGLIVLPFYRGRH
jgi:hypothetical protein